jgi:DNA-binding MarR family transcriptional regulator
MKPITTTREECVKAFLANNPDAMRFHQAAMEASRKLAADMNAMMLQAFGLSAEAAAPPQPLTPAQSRVLDAIHRADMIHGRPPTMQELADTLGITRTTVHGHIVTLRNKGHIPRNDGHKARATRAIDVRVHVHALVRRFGHQAVADAVAESMEEQI